MGSGPGSPFDLEDKAPPEPPGCLIWEELQTLHISTKKKLEVLDTIQATSFFPWWLLLFFQEDFEAKGDLQKFLGKKKKSQACIITSDRK